VGTVDVSAVADPQNDGFTVVFVDSAKQSICSASCAPDAFQLTSQGSANSAWVHKEGTRDEVDESEGGCFGELVTDGAGRWRRDYELVAGVGHLGRRAFTASGLRSETAPAGAKEECSDDGARCYTDGDCPLSG
jgi:hypothetical protein